LALLGLEFLASLLITWRAKIAVHDINLPGEGKHTGLELNGEKGSGVLQGVTVAWSWRTRGGDSTRARKAKTFLSLAFSFDHGTMARRKNSLDRQRMGQNLGKANNQRRII